MAVRVITPPSVEPITLDEAKAYLRVDGTEEDALICSLISAARQHAEQWLRRALITQELRATLDVPRTVTGPLSGPVGRVNTALEIPRPPLQTVTAVEVETSPGTWTPLAPTDYVVDPDEEPATIMLAGGGWGGRRVRVTYTAGYGPDGTAVPAPIRQGMLLLIGDWYEHREQTIVGVGRVVLELPSGVQKLWASYRIWEV